MREIYQKTERCLVLLGEFSNAKPVTTMFDLIRKGKELKSASDIKNLPPKDKYRFWESLGLLEIDDFAWEAVNDIMTALWWNRVWVIQEITFLKEVMVFCGDEKWDWDEMIELHKFVIGSSSWVSIYHGNLNIIINWGGLKQVSNMRSERIQPLHELLLAFRGRGATDPRNNVFALLSMDFDQEEITVPLRAARLWIEYMEKSYDLDEFRNKFLKTPQKDLSEKDYSMSFRALKAFLRAEEAYTKYCSTYGINLVAEGSELRREKDSLPLVESLKNWQSLLADYNMDIARVYIMKMQRLLYDETDLDVLIEIGHSLANNHGLPSWVIDWFVSDELIGKYDQDNKYPAACDSQLIEPPEMSGIEVRLEGYHVETIRYISQSLLIHRGAGKDFLEAESEEERELMSEQLMEEDRSTSRDLAIAATNCMKREIILRDKGNVGLAPATAAIGDRVFLLRGGCMPLVLRRREWKGKEREVEGQLEERPPKQVTEQDLMLGVMKTILEIKNIETTSPDESLDVMQKEQGKASKWEFTGNCYVNGMMDSEEWVESRCADVTLV
ncbi:hypothetical protein BHYA_0056g00520 [Botrytis hyacinthi]|uniref:Heterokaryon incompatibility domain-containing protein n=1 Tax=Botrytis hyacinthi TaxID=278943 RepID=A0A4Z1GVV3_9HELO|nr:hypothetical protein BHYA_0056g00520 [Botrytis hyacinthi]